jgi:uncharacterized protein YaaN involved in tellurite resistance
MSEYESLRTEIERMATSYVAYAEAVDRYAAVVNEQVAALWADNAELRDELHAVSNRLENLTRYIVTAPAEVAQRGFIRPAADLKDEPA